MEWGRLNLYDMNTWTLILSGAEGKEWNQGIPVRYGVPGVYVIWDNEEIYYVGESKNLNQRLTTHPVLRVMFGLGYEVKVSWKKIIGTDVERKMVEDRTIAKMNPTINRRVKHKSRPDKKRFTVKFNDMSRTDRFHPTRRLRKATIEDLQDPTNRVFYFEEHNDFKRISRMKAEDYTNYLMLKDPGLKAQFEKSCEKDYNWVNGKLKEYLDKDILYIRKMLDL